MVIIPPSNFFEIKLTEKENVAGRPTITTSEGLTADQAPRLVERGEAIIRVN